MPLDGPSVDRSFFGAWLGTVSLGCLDTRNRSYYQWIGLRENLQENPIFNGKIYGFLEIFP